VKLTTEIEKMTTATPETERYARTIAASRRIRWDIDKDVIRSRGFDLSRPFLPDGLTRISRLEFLAPGERIFLSQIQGRTYANMFGLVERFIGIKMLDLCRDHAYGDQVALEALVRFTDEELKHQELFRRVELLAAQGMPPGYEFLPAPNRIAGQVLQSSTWAVLALICHIELFTQVHYRQSIDMDGGVSDLFKDVLLFHWLEESQHALVDELEWERENRRIDAPARDRAVNDLIALVGALDGVLQIQASADARYFVGQCRRVLDGEQASRVSGLMLEAYRWQYIGSGIQSSRFATLLGSMVTSEQGARIQGALAPLVENEV
jgi:hypothetical protein